MTTITIIPESAGPPPRYRAIAGKTEAVGKTAGEALDALASQLDEASAGTLLVVQCRRPDEFFTAAQQERLQELMTRWRAARDAGAALPAEEQAELDGLVDAELRASAARAAALRRQLGP
jgi:hypothetical protein